MPCRFNRTYLQALVVSNLARLLEMRLSSTLILVVSIRDVSGCFIAFYRPKVLKTAGALEYISMILSVFRITLKLLVPDFSI